MALAARSVAQQGLDDLVRARILVVELPIRVGVLDRDHPIRVRTLTDLAIATRPDWMCPLGEEPASGGAHDDWTARVAAHVTHRDLNQLTEPGEVATRTTARPLALATPPNRPQRLEARTIHR